jgi:hypothetical protein
MTITYNDLPLTVEFEFFGGYKNPRGTHPHDSSPEYPDYVEIESVHIGDHELTDVMSEEAIDDIAELILRRLRDDQD